VAPKKTTKTPPSGGSAAGRASLDDAATFIGSSLGELMNRKDALARQLATVEKQIAAARDRVTSTVSSTVAAARKVVPSRATKTKTTAKAAAPAGRKGNRKKKRPLPPNDPMVQATTRNATAQVKARTARTMRTSRRSGNR
jgi:hypothetical protein